MRTTRWFNRRADLVICGTKFVERDYNNFVSELGLTPARNTTAIGYGIDLSAFPNVWDPPRSREFDAVHLGRMHQHKGVFDLPHVWKQVIEKRPGARLLVIGEGPHRQACADLCKELGIAENVHFTGGIPEAEKKRLLASARGGLSAKSPTETMAATWPHSGSARGATARNALSAPHSSASKCEKPM